MTSNVALNLDNFPHPTSLISRDTTTAEMYIDSSEDSALTDRLLKCFPCTFDKSTSQGMEHEDIIDPNAPGEANSENLVFTPLGSGQEVGRSCHLLQYKGKQVLLDCGIHPGMSGVDALPFVDAVDLEKVDVLLITHFHLDHCGALPWLLTRTNFKGKVYMTYATKSIFRLMISDYIKVAKFSGGSDGRTLFTEEDLDRSFERIEAIDFKVQVDLGGLKFSAYVAGHVLGACMFLIEIGGSNFLYTGDFSRLEDRHLCSAEIPPIRPDVVISESTYGMQQHEARDSREKRFTSMVHDIVNRGGRCLIPAFALGRAQELLLILDEYWSKNEDLQEIPIYYASALAQKCMDVYQTFVTSMNKRIQQQIGVNNPFKFKHISYLKGIEQFEDTGPCVVLASPGMLQNGLSRELFEAWCTDSKNGCIIAGYCVEGTLAKHILSDPEEIIALNGQRLPRRLEVGYISFSAHADYEQTSDFIKQMRPSHLILVHGEMHEMSRLKAGIQRQFEEENIPIQVHNPRNTERLEIDFKRARRAKIIGKLANDAEDGKLIGGVIVERDFEYKIMDPSDLMEFSSIPVSKLVHRLSIPYNGTSALLVYNLRQITNDIIIMEEQIDSKEGRHQSFAAFKGEIKLQWVLDKNMIIVSWNGGVINDMYADALSAAIMHAQINPIPDKKIPSLAHLPTKQESILAAIREVCGDSAVITIGDGLMKIEVDEKEAELDMGTLRVCCSDPHLEHLLKALASKIAICVDDP
ncbi:unnamed protein product, partial [Mesorhabditis belari]|uniref:Cleavage and polyadenylation specificity factor subunit 3 n=1 Tax=Mesorhabditis belari TaxID=2138241 RepID=A0AAF3FAI0_9BILA